MSLLSSIILTSLLFLTTGGTAQSSDLETKKAFERAKAVAQMLRDSESYYDQITGAGTLVELGDKEALRFIVENLSHPDWVLMRSAIDTLLSVQHPSGADVIYRAVETSKDTMFLKFLAESLTHRAREDMSGFLLDMLEIEDQWVKKHAMQAIDFIDFDGKREKLLELSESEDRDRVIRAYAYMALIDDTAQSADIENLITIAQEWDSSAGEAAAVGLGRVDSPRSREVLRELRNSKYPKIQIAALASEVGFGITDSRQRLIDIIVGGKGLDPSVAAASLRRMPHEVSASLTRELIACCELSSDVGTRVLESWSNIGNVPKDIYEWGLNHKNADIRLQAIWLVGYTGAMQYLNEVIMAMEEDDSGLKGMAAWSTVRLLFDLS